jgi:DNA-3-methyladenine glycosylase I
MMVCVTRVPSGLASGADGRLRCAWSNSSDDYRAYHDLEWGRPVTDDRRLFEKICLEGFQAGLSWLTILRKRDRFREVFADFDFDRVARFGEARVDRLLTDPGIVRHRGKILSTINNAKHARALRDEYGSLAAYFWRFEPDADARPTRVTWDVLTTMSTTPASLALSKDLRRRGWTFVGPTTVYAFMQAMGLVNDHVEGCHARPAVESARKKLHRPNTGPMP